jgi:hypothetical protein
MRSWWNSIEDEGLKARLEHGTIVTGGCITSMLLKETPSDYDVYFRYRELAVDVAKYYVDRFSVKNAAGIRVPIHVDESKPDRVQVVVKSSGVASDEGTEKPYEYFEGQPDASGSEYVSAIMDDPGEIQDEYESIVSNISDSSESADSGSTETYRPVFLSTNAITLSGKIQLVLRFYGEPSDIHENYDFVHCTNYWQSRGDSSGVCLNLPALESILSKELRYVGSKYPLASLIRIRKFVARGWTINAGQILKIVMQLNDLDLNNLDILRDQLTGVDVAYFVQLVARLKERDPAKVNTAYLVEIIDRMF